MAQARSEDSKAFKKINFKFGNYKLRYAWVSQRGYYPEDLDKANQDAHWEVENFGNEHGISDCAYFAVYDGHGKTGDHCAGFARDNIHLEFAKQLGKHAESLNTTSIEAACKKAFVDVNQALHDSSVDDSMSGTTAIAVCFYRGEIVVANVGDSRAIIGEQRGGKLLAFPLSNDQTPFRKDERDRVKAAGAVVANMDQMDGLEEMHENWTEAGAGDEDEDDSGDPPRVWLKSKMLPGCAFTRSIGDSVGESVGVFAEPEIVTKELKQSDRYLIIASDGVWEFLTNQTVINMVAAYKSPLKACKAVVNEAYKLWLQYDVRTDDITMIAIYLEDMANLQDARDAEMAALATVATSKKQDDTVDEMKRRQSVRELRRKSQALVQNPGTSFGVMTNAKKVDTEEARPVRRVMTKEKRKAVLTSSQEEATLNASKEEEKGFKYEVMSEKLSEDDVTAIMKACSTNFLLAHLNKTQQQEVYSSMQECKCKTGDTIISAGQPGDWFYVIKSGGYEATIEGALIHTYNVVASEANDDGMEGTSFGELALLYSGKFRAATITCTADGTIWRLSAKTFREVVMRSSTQQLLKTLRSVEVLKALTLSQMQQLYDALSEVKVEDGERVITEGDKGLDFYVIMDGSAKVLKKTASGEEELMKLKKFDYFGERALLNDAPRAASVIATSPMKLLQISKKHFEEVLGSLDVIIDTHRRKREETARRSYLQRQAEGLLDASPHEFNPISKVAKWVASDVYLAERKGSDEQKGEVTIRVISKKRATDEKLRSRVMQEIKLMGEMMPSPFVPSLLATFSDRSRLYSVLSGSTVMELTKLIDGKPLIKAEGGEAIVRFYVGSAILAIFHLHRQEIAYRMLTLDQILLNGKGYPQLVDFTLSKKLAECGGRTFTLIGVPEYNAPEQVLKFGHGLQPDWWAVGILMYEMLFATTPFAPPDSSNKSPVPTRASAPAPTKPESDGSIVSQRRPSMSLQTLAQATEQAADDASDRASTMATYKAIAEYYNKESMTIPYPKTASDGSEIPAPSKAVDDLLDDLLEKKMEQRLGCRSSAFEDFTTHPFFLDFDFQPMEDNTFSAPHMSRVQEEMAALKKAAPTSFDAPPYVGDNRWCDDWDYTCTVGATSENAADSAGKTGVLSANMMRRKSTDQGGQGGTGERRMSAAKLPGMTAITE